MELLVRIVDKERSGNVVLDARRTQAGDVIAAMPDGHGWGTEELRNPEWRILRVPGLPRALADALIAPEPPRAFAASRVLRKRQMVLDIAFLDAATDGALLGPRALQAPDAIVSYTVLHQSHALKSPLRDPRMIGPDPARIG